MTPRCWRAGRRASYQVSVPSDSVVASSSSMKMNRVGMSCAAEGFPEQIGQRPSPR